MEHETGERSPPRRPRRQRPSGGRRSRCWGVPVVAESEAETVLAAVEAAIGDWRLLDYGAAWWRARSPNHASE